MQTQRILVRRLERTLTLVIALALVFAGLCIYVYLVETYESHWTRRVVPPPSHLQAESWPARCVYHVRWAPIESQADPGHPETFQPHAWFTLPADALETLLLLSQDRHASGVLHLSQSAGTNPYITEVEVQAFYESEEELLRPDTRTVYALRRDQGGYGIGVFAEQKRLQQGAREGFTPNIMAWLPEQSFEVDMAIRVVPMLASAPQQPRHVIDNDPSSTPSQTTLSSTDADALIELDTGILDEKRHIFAPNRYLRGEFNISSSFELVTTRESMVVLAKTLNDGLPFSVADAVPWRTSPASIHEGDSDRYFYVHVTLQNSELVTGPSESPLGSAQVADAVSPSAISDSDLYLYPEHEGSFKFLVVNTHPFVIEKHVTEDPTEWPQARHVTSRIVGRGVSLIREDVE